QRRAVRRRRRRREEQVECCPAFSRRRHPDRATEVVDDARNDGKAKPRTLPWLLRREEWVEDLLAERWVDPGPRISDHQLDDVSRGRAGQPQLGTRERRVLDRR